jgi:hypothetical protein
MSIQDNSFVQNRWVFQHPMIKNPAANALKSFLIATNAKANKLECLSLISFGGLV